MLIRSLVVIIGSGGVPVVKCTPRPTRSPVVTPVPSPKPTSVETANPTRKPSMQPTQQPTLEPIEPGLTRQVSWTDFWCIYRLSTTKLVIETVYSYSHVILFCVIPFSSTLCILYYIITAHNATNSKAHRAANNATDSTAYAGTYWAGYDSSSKFFLGRLYVIWPLWPISGKCFILHTYINIIASWT